MRKILIMIFLFSLSLFLGCGNGGYNNEGNSLRVQILEKKQTYEGDLTIKYEVENLLDYYVNEYIVEFKITEYDNQISYISETNYDIAPGEIDEYTITTKVKPPPIGLEEWNSGGGINYIAYVEVSNVVIMR